MAACASGRVEPPSALPVPVAVFGAPPVIAPPGVPTDAGVRAPAAAPGTGRELRVGPNDLLEIKVFEAPELDRAVRVAGTGQISLPLLGEVAAAGRTPQEIEALLETRLRARYIRDPHVSVQVTEMESHPVSVVGAVAKPGVFQIRESRSLLELIAMAGGLAPDAGETVVVVRAPPLTDDDAVSIDLRALLETGDSRYNIAVNPGDLVKVTPAGLVYVVGEVRRPGAFPLARRPGLTVLQAVALGEGLSTRAAGGNTTIIRTTAEGRREELRVDLGDVVAGRAVDVALQAQDVVYVPGSAAKRVTLGLVDALVRMVTLRGVF